MSGGFWPRLLGWRRGSPDAATEREARLAVPNEGQHGSGAAVADGAKSAPAVGANATSEPHFVAVAELDELPVDSRLVVEVGGHAVLVLNLAGTLYAVPNTCPHRAWPLSEATESAGVLKCGRHGWEFDVPSGRGTWPPFGYGLRHLPLRVQQGVIEVAWTEPAVELAH